MHSTKSAITVKQVFICQPHWKSFHPQNTPRIHCVMRGYFITQTKEITSLVTPNVCSKHPLGPHRQHPGILHPALDSRPLHTLVVFSGYSENQDWVEPTTLTTTTTTQTVKSSVFIGWLAGDKTAHDSQAWAPPATFGLQPQQFVCSTLCCSFTQRLLAQKPSQVASYPHQTRIH